MVEYVLYVSLILILMFGVFKAVKDKNIIYIPSSFIVVTIISFTLYVHMVYTYELLIMVILSIVSIQFSLLWNTVDKNTYFVTLMINTVNLLIGFYSTIGVVFLGLKLFGLFDRFTLYFNIFTVQTILLLLLILIVTTVRVFYIRKKVYITSLKVVKSIFVLSLVFAFVWIFTLGQYDGNNFSYYGINNDKKELDSELLFKVTRETIDSPDNLTIRVIGWAKEGNLLYVGFSQSTYSSPEYLDVIFTIDIEKGEVIEEIEVNNLKVIHGVYHGVLLYTADNELNETALYSNKTGLLVKGNGSTDDGTFYSFGYRYLDRVVELDNNEIEIAFGVNQKSEYIIQNLDLSTGTLISSVIGDIPVEDENITLFDKEGNVIAEFPKYSLLYQDETDIYFSQGTVYHYHDYQLTDLNYVGGYHNAFKSNQGFCVLDNRFATCYNSLDEHHSYYYFDRMIYVSQNYHTFDVEDGVLRYLAWLPSDDEHYSFGYFELLEPVYKFNIVGLINYEMCLMLFLAFVPFYRKKESK